MPSSLDDSIELCVLNVVSPLFKEIDWLNTHQTAITIPFRLPRANDVGREVDRSYLERIHSDHQECAQELFSP